MSEKIYYNKYMNIASEKTKKLLAKTLVLLLKEKDFSKITITDITRRAKVNRKTFYYHFKSTEQLLEWMIERDALDIIKNYNLNTEFDNAIDFVMNYLEENQVLLRSLNHAVGRGAVHKFLFRNLYPAILASIIDHKVIADQNTDYQSFLAEFYTEAVTGVLQNWLEKPILRNRDEVAEYLRRIVNGISL